MTKLEIGPSASGTTVQMDKGSEAQLTLPETRTAGYSWKIVSPGAPALGVEDAGFTRAGGVGGTGSHRWTLKAKQAGRAALELAYARSWESEAEAKRRFSVTIVVS